MSALRRAPMPLLVPTAAAAAVVATVSGVAWPPVVALLVAVALRARVRPPAAETASRAWTAAWVSLPAVATGYVAAVARAGGDPAPALLSAATAALAIAALSPASGAATARLGALQGVVVAGACLASPTATTAAAAVAYVLLLAGATLRLPVAVPPPSYAGSEGAVRRVRAPAPARPRAPMGTLAALLVLGLAAGLWLFATLPAAPSARRDRDAEAAASGARAPHLDGPGATREGRERASTGPGAGATSPFHASLDLDPRVALTVRVDDGVKGPAPLRLRGTAYDVFDGRSWSRSPEANRAAPLDEDPERPGFLRVRRDPVVGRAHRLHVTDVAGRARRTPLWLLAGTRAVRLVGRDDPEAVRVAADGTVVVADGTRWAPGDAYETWGPAEGDDRDGLDALASDASVSPLPSLVAPPPDAAAFEAVARRVVGPATSAAARAEAIERWLRRPPFRHAHADLTADPRRPVADFLLRTREGHCWCFASAMTALMRSLGHPARLVVGLRGGDWMETLGLWSLRGTDAHAWCEVWFEGRGWVTYDPTPGVAETHTGEGGAAGGDDGPAWWDRLAGWSPSDRRRWLDGVAGSVAAAGGTAGLWLPPLVAAACGAALLARWRRRVRAGRAAVAPSALAPEGSYVRALVALAGAGVRRRAAETPVEFLARARGAHPDVGPPLSVLTAQHDAERYGAVAGDAAARRDAAAAARAVEAALRARGPSGPPTPAGPSPTDAS